MSIARDEINVTKNRIYLIKQKWLIFLSGKRRMAILDLLISASKSNTNLDDDGIREEVDTFILAVRNEPAADDHFVIRQYKFGLFIILAIDQILVFQHSVSFPVPFGFVLILFTNTLP